MNDAKLQLDAGNLTGAVEAAIRLVKTNPTNEAARTFLFELSCFSGDWDRAEKQLEVIGHQDTNAMIGSLIFRQNFMAERNRLKLFSDGLSPVFIGPQSAHLAELFNAVNRVREGSAVEARTAIDHVEEERPAYKCEVNGEGFSDFRDYNDLTMCVFEAIHKDSYVWLPFEDVDTINFFESKTLRDLYWIQAEVKMRNGIEGEMFLPSLYSGTWKSGNDQVRLGRMTDWREIGDEVFVGEGTKLFWMDGRDKSILDIKTIKFVREEPSE
ncbi:MAG: type VI secretion system accessory protein TagJ [Pyrinomonadaceae bacterium]